MGLDGSFILERRIEGQWHPQRDQFATGLHNSLTMDLRGNCLFEAYLLGGGDVCSFFNHPDLLDDDWRIVDKYRGLPQDVSPETRNFIGDLKHMSLEAKPSYTTLAEMLSYDWMQPLEMKTKLSAADLYQWQQQDHRLIQKPLKHSGSYSSTDQQQEARLLGPKKMSLIDLKKVIAEVEDQVAADLKPASGWASHQRVLFRLEQDARHLYTVIERSYPVADYCRDFLGHVLPQMMVGASPEDVRLICWVS